MNRRSVVTGVLVGAGVALLVVLVILPAANRIHFSPPPQSPQLPDGVTASTASGKIPYGSFEDGILFSYWVPFLMLVRERYPDATSFDVFRRRSLALGGSLHPRRNDPDTLFAKLRASAAQNGWTPLRDLEFSNAVYDFECYEQAGYVFCILAFKDTMRTGPSDTIVMDLDALSIPPAGADDFAAVYLITNLAALGDHRPPGISASAPPIGKR